jgi:cellulose biosynthesis protein BcsQ
MDQAPHKPKVIAFANQKGGVAKTTTALNLAVAFMEKGFRVLCIDMDPQGNLTMSQGIDPDTLDKSMYDVLVHQTRSARCAQARGRRRLRVDRPRRRRDRDEHR